jgi:hypothetical protein
MGDDHSIVPKRPQVLLARKCWQRDLRQTLQFTLLNISANELRRTISKGYRGVNLGASIGGFSSVKAASANTTTRAWR